MKYLICFFCALLSLGLSYSIQANEPLPDRARVIGLQADLLLPQGGILKVEMNTDCGSPYENLSALAMSEQGAKIIAAGLGVLYGEKMKRNALRLWSRKANPLDQRKPTFLVVQGVDYTQQTEHNQYESYSRDLLEVVVSSVCGGTLHPN